jgi:hypothetical protein
MSGYSRDCQLRKKLSNGNSILADQANPTPPTPRSLLVCHIDGIRFQAYETPSQFPSYPDSNSTICRRLSRHDPTQHPRALTASCSEAQRLQSSSHQKRALRTMSSKMPPMTIRGVSFTRSISRKHHNYVDIRHTSSCQYNQDTDHSCHFGSGSNLNTFSSEDSS